jgi:hypothetical protein
VRVESLPSDPTSVPPESKNKANNERDMAPTTETWTSPGLGLNSIIIATKTLAITKQLKEVAEFVSIKR